MKNYHRIISKVCGEPWAIKREKLFTIVQQLDQHIGGGDTMAGTGNFDGYSGTGVPSKEMDHPEPQTIGSTRIIPIFGIIGKHLSGMELMCGGCSLDAVNNLLDDAAADNLIDRVVLDFASPGGTVTGVPETASKIADLSDAKDVISYCESECCSAALWLASQASRFYAAPSATIGSVGVYSIYQDWSKWLEAEGVKINAISAGKYKLSGAWFRPISEDETKVFQAKIDSIYEEFKGAVNLHRAVSDESMQGQVFSGRDAVAAGFLDGNLDTIDGLLEFLSGD